MRKTINKTHDVLLINETTYAVACHMRYKRLSYIRAPL